jgi:hypothetical protein
MTVAEVAPSSATNQATGQELFFFFEEVGGREKKK